MSEASRRLPIWPGDSSSDGHVSPGTRTKRQLRAITGHVVSGARQVADESDHLFVLAITGVNGGFEKAAQGLAGIGQRISIGKLAVRLGLRTEQTTHDRVRKLLLEEVKRARIEVTVAQFDEFAEKMGLLFELIFSGVIRIEDIALEADEPDEREAVAPTEDDRQLSFAW